MKKIIVIIITIIYLIILNSCGNYDNEQQLLEMRDYIQAKINWQEEAIEKEFQELDSLYNVDRDKYYRTRDFYIKNINILHNRLDENKNRLYQIELEINKK